MNAKLKGWILLAAGLCLAVSVFLPFITVEISLFGEVTKETSSMMPSIGGILVLIAGGAAAFVPLAGLQKQAPIIGTGAGLLSGGLLIRQYFRAKTASGIMNAYTGGMSEAFGGSSADFTTKVTFEFGFYFAIIAILAVIFMSILYGLSDEY